MTADEFILITQTIGMIIFYAIVGMAPGMAFGLWIGNWIGARDKETLMEKHEANIEAAEKHNQQWDPTNQRWQDRG